VVGPSAVLAPLTLGPRLLGKKQQLDLVTAPRPASHGEPPTSSPSCRDPHSIGLDLT
jgi:hypothetical protein